MTPCFATWVSASSKVFSTADLRQSRTPMTPGRAIGSSCGGIAACLSGDRLLAQWLLQSNQAGQDTLVDRRIDLSRHRSDASESADHDHQCGEDHLGARSLKRLEWITASEQVRIERVQIADRVRDRRRDAAAEVGRMMLIVGGARVPAGVGET